MKAITRLQYGYRIPSLDEFSVATLKLILNLVDLLKALTKFSRVILSLAVRIPAGPEAERFPHKTIHLLKLKKDIGLSGLPTLAHLKKLVQTIKHCNLRAFQGPGLVGDSVHTW